MKQHLITLALVIAGVLIANMLMKRVPAVDNLING